MWCQVVHNRPSLPWLIGKLPGSCFPVPSSEDCLCSTRPTSIGVLVVSRPLIEKDLMEPCGSGSGYKSSLPIQTHAVK